jgi:hypothetical protein
VKWNQCEEGGCVVGGSLERQKKKSEEERERQLRKRGLYMKTLEG